MPSDHQVEWSVGWLVRILHVEVIATESELVLWVIASFSKVFSESTATQVKLFFIAGKCVITDCGCIGGKSTTYVVLQEWISRTSWLLSASHQRVWRWHVVSTDRACTVIHASAQAAIILRLMVEVKARSVRGLRHRIVRCAQRSVSVVQHF